MSASVITYSSAISKSVKINEIYLDTSFVIDLIVSITTPSLLSDPKIRDTKTFYDFLSKSKTEMWTSYLTAEEAMFKNFRNKMGKEIENFEKSKSLPPKSLNYNDFKKKYSADFELAYNKVKSVFYAILLLGRKLNIKIKLPKEYSIKSVSSRGERIVQYATALLNFYTLEVADAFHISTARCNGTKCIATNDLGFKQVDNITIFSFK